MQTNNGLSSNNVNLSCSSFIILFFVDIIYNAIGIISVFTEEDAYLLSYLIGYPESEVIRGNRYTGSRIRNYYCSLKMRYL